MDGQRGIAGFKIGFAGVTFGGAIFECIFAVVLLVTLGVAKVSPESSGSWMPTFWACTAFLPVRRAVLLDVCAAEVGGTLEGLGALDLGLSSFLGIGLASALHSSSEVSTIPNLA